MKLESEIQQLIMMEGPKHGIWLLRNNSGQLQDKDGRYVQFGLGNSGKAHNQRFKSSDLIGLHNPSGRLVAIEVKKQGWKYTGTDRELAQKAFIDWVIARGGVAGFCASVEDFLNLIGELKAP